MSGDAWDPEQYSRFASERAAPFHDLLSLVHPIHGGRAVDLGCGTGELTLLLHEHLGAAETVGIDNSAAMFERAADKKGGGVRFAMDDIGPFTGAANVDVVFANASLQWVPDHPAVLRRWTAALTERGQLAVQVPANADHPSHTTSTEVAHQQPFVDAFDGGPPPDPVLGVLAPEKYATLLDELDFAEQHVRLQVYGHRLASSADVVEWTKGTSLTRFQRRLPADLFPLFVERYRARLLDVIGDRRPYFYAFKRILFWGRRQ